MFDDEIRDESEALVNLATHLAEIIGSQLAKNHFSGNHFGDLHFDFRETKVNDE